MRDIRIENPDGGHTIYSVTASPEVIEKLYKHAMLGKRLAYLKLIDELEDYNEISSYAYMLQDLGEHGYPEVFRILMNHYSSNFATIIDDDAWKYSKLALKYKQITLLEFITYHLSNVKWMELIRMTIMCILIFLGPAALIYYFFNNLIVAIASIPIVIFLFYKLA